MSTMITAGLVSAVVIPAIAPTCLDLIACIRIWIMNRAKGRPTWIVGTRFPMVIFASGNVLKQVIISSVSFKFVTLRTVDGLIDIKKRDMLKLSIVYLD